MKEAGGTYCSQRPGLILSLSATGLLKEGLYASRPLPVPVLAAEALNANH